jgi:hypothetical protein
MKHWIATLALFDLRRALAPSARRQPDRKACSLRFVIETMEALSTKAANLFAGVYTVTPPLCAKIKLRKVERRVKNPRTVAIT